MQIFRLVIYLYLHLHVCCIFGTSSHSEHCPFGNSMPSASSPGFSVIIMHWGRCHYPLSVSARYRSRSPTYNIAPKVHVRAIMVWVEIINLQQVQPSALYCMS